MSLRDRRDVGDAHVERTAYDRRGHRWSAVERRYVNVDTCIPEIAELLCIEERGVGF